MAHSSACGASTVGPWVLREEDARAHTWCSRLGRLVVQLGQPGVLQRLDDRAALPGIKLQHLLHQVYGKGVGVGELLPEARFLQAQAPPTVSMPAKGSSRPAAQMCNANEYQEGMLWGLTSEGGRALM